MKQQLSLLIGIVMLITGCAAKIPDAALQLNHESLADRQQQTRLFDTTDKQAMLSAAASTLQDLGFALDESEYTLGVLVASKNRDATSGGQVAAALFVAALTGAVTHVDKNQVIRVSMVMRELESDTPQQPAPTKLTPAKIEQIRTIVHNGIVEGFKKEFPADVTEQMASTIAADTANALSKDLRLLSRVKASGGRSSVRVTFQRVIYNTAGMITLAEQVKDPQIYKEFFEKLSKSVFLEAHEL